ncbi:phage filamentation protein Fil family protein [Klebsiella pneumoniae]
MASGSTGWLELPNGQRWNPGHQYKFSARSSRRPWWFRLFGIIRGRYGH